MNTEAHPAVLEIQQQADAAKAAKVAELEQIEQARIEAEKTQAQKLREAAQKRQDEIKRQTAAFNSERGRIEKRIAELAGSAHDWRRAAQQAHEVLAKADDEQRGHYRTLQRLTAQIERLHSDHPFADVERDAALIEPLDGFTLQLDIPDHQRKGYGIGYLNTQTSNLLQHLRKLVS